MKTRLVQIGNSRGIRLPKLLIEEAGLEEDVELEVQGNSVVIRPATAPRAGWAEAAADLGRSGRGLLDAETPTSFDREEWSW